MYVTYGFPLGKSTATAPGLEPLPNPPALLPSASSIITAVDFNDSTCIRSKSNGCGGSGGRTSSNNTISPT